jgi:hypothetical protein
MLAGVTRGPRLPQTIDAERRLVNAAMDTLWTVSAFVIKMFALLSPYEYIHWSIQKSSGLKTRATFTIIHNHSRYAAALFVPVVADGDLKAVELRIVRGELAIRDVIPVEADFPWLPIPAAEINTAAGARRKIEGLRAVDRRQVGSREESTAGKFEEGHRSVHGVGRVEAQNERLEAAAAHRCRSPIGEQRHQIHAVLEVEAPPACADAAFDGFAGEYSGGPHLLVGKRISNGRACCSRGPDANVPRSAFGMRRRLRVYGRNGGQDEKRESRESTDRAQPGKPLDPFHALKRS